jgi:hypothetical protein
MGWRLRIQMLVVGLVALAGVAQRGSGQTVGSMTEAAAAELQAMSAHAGVVFSGQVVAVDRSDASGFVDVRFRVDRCVRGCVAGGRFYVVREWAGLWSGNPDRYRVGDRRLMLLTARSGAGFSSPVAGMDGAIPVVATGVEPLARPIPPADIGVAVASLGVDLRWVQARAPRVAAAPDGGKPGAVAGSHRAVMAVQAAALPVPLGDVLALLGASMAQNRRGVADARF